MERMRRLNWPNSRAEQMAIGVGLFLLMSGVTHLAILFLSGGTWNGPVSWRKPATFGLSFGLTLISVTWVASYLDLRSRSRALLIGTLTAASAWEAALVTVQAWRHVPSHFNFETSFDAVVARALAAAGFGNHGSRDPCGLSLVARRAGGRSRDDRDWDATRVHRRHSGRVRDEQRPEMDAWTPDAWNPDPAGACVGGTKRFQGFQRFYRRIPFANSSTVD